MTSETFHAGFAQVDFTPPPGLPLRGQMHQRLATGARDPLLACAMAMRRGDVTVALVSVDVCAMDLPLVASIQTQWQSRTGLPGSTLLLHATHTHDAPTPSTTLMEQAIPEFVASLRAAILESAQTAVERLEPVEVFAGCGQMEQMGWNRRAMFEDGTSKMYGHSEMPGFIGMEGPRDPALPVLHTRNPRGEITGVLVNFATHPNSIESALTYSADVPGAVRRHLRRSLGEEVGVVYLTGAAGNTAPSILDPVNRAQPWRGDEGLERSGLYLAGEAVKVIASSIEPMSEPRLELRNTSLPISPRAWPKVDEHVFGNSYYERAASLWPDYARQNPTIETRANVLRIGDAVLCTNPAELFVEFGLQIRAASPARVTFISELTDGCVGYVPTELAFGRGGYETWCAPSSQLVPEAGARIVKATTELLAELDLGSSHEGK